MVASGPKKASAKGKAAAKDGTKKMPPPKMKLRAKGPTKTVDDETGKDVADPQLQPMDAGHLKQLCSWLEWHGVKKTNPDASVRKLMSDWQNADAVEKR